MLPDFKWSEKYQRRVLNTLVRIPCRVRLNVSAVMPSEQPTLTVLPADLIFGRTRMGDDATLAVALNTWRVLRFRF